MVKIFLDCEMTGLTMKDQLISIGAAYTQESTGKVKTFYAEFNDYDESNLSDWIKENVIKNLKFNDKHSMKIESVHDVRIKSDTEYIANEFRKWITNIKDDAMFVADVGHYDIVFTYDIFGGAFNIPENLSATYHDLNIDIARKLRISESKAFDICREDLIEENIEVAKHNALYDALVCKSIYENMDPTL